MLVERQLAPVGVARGVLRAEQHALQQANRDRPAGEVPQIDVDGMVAFADRQALQAYVRALGIWRRDPEAVPDLAEPIAATTRNAIFVAQKS